MVVLVNCMLIVRFFSSLAFANDVPIQSESDFLNDSTSSSPL
jgi:hypothetical protein